MIDKIREWNIKDKMINVKYTDNTGNKKMFTINQNRLLLAITDIVTDYSNQNLKLTNRQLYYQLVSKDIIPNSEETYKRICTFITDARYGGYIDWEAIEDRGRVPSQPLEFNNIKERVELSLRNFRLPRWKDQDYYVELYSEKQAMESVLQPIASQYHITFGCNKGYSSASTMYDLAQRIKEKIEEGKKTVILYLGDHDPSGLDMVRDIRERITEFIVNSQDSTTFNKDYVGEDKDEVFIDDETVSEYFQIVPLALNMTQIKRYNPPPNPAKITDPRAKWYIEKYGRVSWELDALPPKVLVQIAKDGILDYFDSDKYQEWIEKEDNQKKELQDFCNKMKVD